MITLFREPEPNEHIVIAGDPAEGGDNSTFVAVSKQYADVIMVGKSKEESSQLGHTLNHIGLWFHKRTNVFPTIAVEKNMGAATLYVLKSLNYPRLYKMPNSFTKSDVPDSGQPHEEQYGWSTNVATRPKMLDDLALAIRQRVIKIPSKQVIDELYTFIRNEKTGKPEGDVGSNDDLVIALAISWQLYQTAGSDLPLGLDDSLNKYDSINKGLNDKWKF